MYLTPRDLYSIIDHHNVEPFLTFTAAAGPDYGQVLAWEIVESYLIKYGNNAETKYDFVSDVDDPAEWLEERDLSPIGRIVETANIRGADYVEDANNHDIGPFYVMTTKYLKSGGTISQIEMDDCGAIEFESYEKAADWIEEVKYELSGNEIQTPSHKIIA